nr:hypothetical protein [uncultured Kingella sp.]
MPAWGSLKKGGILAEDVFSGCPHECIGSRRILQKCTANQRLEFHQKIPAASSQKFGIFANKNLNTETFAKPQL